MPAIQVLNYSQDDYPAGTYEFKLIEAADYVVGITAENGGPTAILFKDKDDDAGGIEDGVVFVSGEAYGAIVTVPLGFNLYITLAGAEQVTFKIHRRPDQ